MDAPPAAYPDRPSWMGAAVASVTTATVVLTIIISARAAGDPLGFAERRLPVALVSVGVALVGSMVAAAWALRRQHPRGCAALALAVIASLVPLWAAWSWLPGRVRAAMLASTPLALPCIAGVAIWWSGQRRRTSHELRAATVLAGVACAIHALAYDPFADPGCARVCSDVTPLMGALASTKGAVASASSLTIACAFVLASPVWASRRARTPSLVVTAVLVALGGLATAAAIRWWAWGHAGLSAASFLVPPAAVGAVAAAVCVSIARTLRTRAALDRLVDRLSQPEAATSDLGGGIVAVNFAVPGSDRWVDALGRDVPDVSDPARAVVVYQDSLPVLRLVLARGADEGDLVAGITPGARLAIQNAQLSAVARARLAEVQASQRRIVAASDGERRRIERDLHDGAQQRLVSVAFHLRVAMGAADPPTAAALSRAEHLVHGALARLRHLAHGIFPSVLVEEGLEEAVREAVASSEVETRLDIRLRGLGPNAAMAAYHLVAAALERGGRPAGHSRAQVSMAQGETTLEVKAEVEPAGGRAASDFVDVADRVGALGGRFGFSNTGHGFVMTAVIPCES